MADIPTGGAWKGYSVAERDRRWSAVRTNAATAGFDCVFVPLCVDPGNLRTSSAGAQGVRADCRYLTLMDNAVVILPADERPPIVINDRGRPNEWVAQPRAAAREARGSWAKSIVDALREAGMERARIGVSGLLGGTVTHVRAFDGVVNHSAYAEVMSALPNARFEDGTDLVGFARYVKSDEELDALRGATAIAEAGLDTMVEMARPGVDEADLYAEVTGRMLELGSGHYHWAMNIGTFDREGPRYTEPPIGRRLRAGSFITNEMSAIWGGMVAQEVQPVSVGPLPEAWRPMVDLTMEVFEAGLEHMKPGTAFPDLIEHIASFSRDRMRASVGLHGRGWGNDGPLITGRAPLDKVRNLRIERGNTWVWKPHVLSEDGRIDFQWGGDVAVTDSGGEVLFRRPREGVICVP
jgi:Xaa-Pro dipeptidase